MYPHRAGDIISLGATSFRTCIADAHAVELHGSLRSTDVESADWMDASKQLARPIAGPSARHGALLATSLVYDMTINPPDSTTA